MQNTVVKTSQIHGNGLFALRDFAVGEIVETVGGWIQSDLEQPSKSKYAMKLSRRKTIILTNKTKYVNHSVTPNVRFTPAKLIALTSIKSGEELTSEYQGLFDK